MPAAALPAELWVNIFNQLSDENDELNTNIFNVTHPTLSNPTLADEHGPFDGRVVELPLTQYEALWNQPGRVPKHRAAQTKTSSGLRTAALQYGSFLFGGSDYSPHGGVYFRYDSDILFLDVSFWEHHFYHRHKCIKNYRKQKAKWERAPPATRGPPLKKRDYIPTILPALTDTQRRSILHIGLPHRWLWSEARYSPVLEETYKYFPNIQYVWIYKQNYGKRPKGVARDTHLAVERLSVGEKHNLNIRKHWPIVEDPTTHRMNRGWEEVAVTLKRTNELKYPNQWLRDPDVPPKAIRYRRLTAYRPGYPWGDEKPPPAMLEMMDYLDADTELDIDTDCPDD
ncbi:hypothetical protein B0T16DRAFT_418028 [Cercophora newfieldiana]|uniref:Uncharacterized protein n=1 Tax=Cercophora newfieldiana TaxID=92897 RepID=A0AA40CPB3_9PEZI|nr:hypothetical protein B0T16DRAFT_418028 [Cercophora newfieldiana]